MREKVIIVKYGEIAMRGNNRKLFVARLVKAIRKNIDPFGNFYVALEQGRLVVESRGAEMDWEVLLPRITCIFGIFGACPGWKLTDDAIEAIRAAACDLMKEQFDGHSSTFKVVTKRGNKKYPLDSNAISAEVGEAVLAALPQLTVDVHHPQQTLYVEVRNHVYLYTSFVPGWGGLPYGSSGKAISLLSGGIDSPTATFLMAKRGVEVEGVYFHTPPYTSERAKKKVESLAKILAGFTGGFTLHVVNFTKVQLYLLDHVPEEKLTIFLKRAMVHTAEQIALEQKAQALVMGDSVGQVASQTVPAIEAISSATQLPILRPLCGMDKQEIVDLAKKTGTFETSIEPYEDCCTVFVAKHPETKPKRSVIEAMERHLQALPELMAEAAAGRETMQF